MCCWSEIVRFYLLFNQNYWLATIFRTAARHDQLLRKGWGWLFVSNYASRTMMVLYSNAIANEGRVQVSRCYTLLLVKCTRSRTKLVRCFFLRLALLRSFSVSLKGRMAGTTTERRSLIRRLSAWLYRTLFWCVARRATDNHHECENGCRLQRQTGMCYLHHCLLLSSRNISCVLM